MKQYDRETKKWIEEDVLKERHSRDKKLCKGKKLHDFVLVLPSHVTYNENYNFKPEEYYRLMDEKVRLEELIYERLKVLGIITKYGTWKPSKHYVCSICKKEKYSDD